MWTPRLCCAAPGTRSLRPGHARLERDQVRGQVEPAGIDTLDQPDLPFAPPTLERVFAGTRLEDRLKLLEIDESVNAEFLREPRHDLAFVFTHPPAQVIGDADIERAFISAGENIHVKGTSHR